MANRCTRLPECEFSEGHFPEHPCGRTPVPGELCAYCGKPTPMDGSSCPTCWISLKDLPLADIKGLLALGGFSVEVSSD